MNVNKITLKEVQRNAGILALKIYNFITVKFGAPALIGIFLLNQMENYVLIRWIFWKQKNAVLNVHKL